MRNFVARFLSRWFVQALLGLSVAAGLILSTPAQANEIPNAVNLRAEAEHAVRTGLPLIVLFTRNGCRYCEQVRRDYLRPMQKSATAQHPVHIRQIHVDHQTPLIDFTGKSTTHAQFAKQQQISLAPVVAFYGHEGQALAPPIVGLRLPDFYQSYLDEAIKSAQQRLRSSARTP